MARSDDLSSAHAHDERILVTIVRAEGSTPREAGAAMTVSWAGVEGTIGGGRLEFDAIALSRAMLNDGDTRAVRSIPLGPQIGQCCGGRVDLLFERVDDALLLRREAMTQDARARQPHVYLFGAGHTGKALANALAMLPFRVCVVDDRAGALAGLPAAVRTTAAAVPEAVIAEAPAGAAFVVLTHDHALDFLIASAALARGDAAYVGMIGSATKRARFARHLSDLGRDADLARLTLPIGGARPRDKRPEVIAAMTAAELCGCLLSEQENHVPVRLAGAMF